MHRKHAQHE
jgi:hypothetical protein